MAEHQLNRVIAQVETTHPGVGIGIAFAMVCVKARKCLLVIAPAGCGKSLISSTLAKLMPGSITLDSVTRSALRNFQDTFTGYRSLVCIDDMGKVDSLYSRTHTVTSFAELCYSHYISKHSMTATVEINDFAGSAILNVQPPILAQLVASDEWEVVTQDKTVRYYHLFRPLTPNQNKLELVFNWGEDFDRTHSPRRDYKLYESLAQLASIQWSTARVLEHLDTLLKATAALDGRQEVLVPDYYMLLKLMRPMAIEQYLMDKAGFEVGRHFDNNLLAILVEFASHKDINIRKIARDYKVHEATAYRLIAGVKEWFKEDTTRSKRLIPTQRLKDILKEVGAR